MTEACSFDDGKQKIRFGGLEHQVLEIFQVGYGEVVKAEAERLGPIEEVRRRLEASGYMDGQSITEKGYTALLTLQKCKERVERGGV